MRVLVVTHYFPPEIGAPQARLSEMAKAWTDDGDDVVVLTGMPNHPNGVIPDEYRRKLRMTGHVDGYEVVRTWLYATPNEGVSRKTLGHLSFMISCVLLGMRRVGRPEVVVVSSPTFFSIFGAWVIAKLKRAALVLDIRDLWPGIFIELGVLTNRWVIWLLERLELWAYGQADEVVVVSEGFRTDLIRRGVPAGKVTTVRNGADIENFIPGGDPVEGRELLGADEDEVVALYIGAHGISHGLDTVIDAASILEEAQAPKIRICLVGEGARRAELVAQVERLRLHNVTMLPGVPRAQVPGLLAAADICLAPLRDVPLFQSFIPSKIFEYLAAGKPIIGALRGEPATIVGDGGGIVVDPGDPGALAAAISALANDAARRAEMGRRARQHVVTHFNRRSLASDFRGVMLRSVEHRRR